jgi:Xaa-Pro aminopeptidase
MQLALPNDSERRALVHLERAHRMLDEIGADAIVAAHPINVYYLTQFETILGRMGFPQASFGVLPRRTDLPETLVTPAAQIWRLAAADLEYAPNIIAYTAPQPDRPDTRSEPPAYPAVAWPAQPDESLAPLERKWATASRRLVSREAPSAEWGLARALRELGLIESRIIVDDPNVPRILAEVGLAHVDCIVDTQFLRRLRLVKSAPELALMRLAAELNASACRAVAAMVEPGLTMREIEAHFTIECGRRGIEPVFIVAGSTGHLPHGEVRRGQAILLDAVSRYRGYHGDFGRTVFVGDPDRLTLRRSNALRVGWEASFAAIKPGARYSDVRLAGLDAMRRAGFGDVLTVANPHSVGLQHTDEPFRVTPGAWVKNDLVLEENMTLTVDFPHIELGGGGFHLEDLVRVTATGAEPLAPMGDALICN